MSTEENDNQLPRIEVDGDDQLGEAQPINTIDVNSDGRNQVEMMLDEVLASLQDTVPLERMPGQDEATQLVTSDPALNIELERIRATSKNLAYRSPVQLINELEEQAANEDGLTPLERSAKRRLAELMSDNLKKMTAKQDTAPTTVIGGFSPNNDN